MPRIREFTLMNDYPVRTITSSTDTTPIKVTFNGHGLVTGDVITITGHVTNTNANGIWTITKVNANEFTLDSSTATGGGAGGNTGAFAKGGRTIKVHEYDKFIYAIDTDGGADAAMTLKFWGSTQEAPPNIGAAQSKTNKYDFVDVIDQEDGASIDGDTGFVVATADNHVTYEANITGTRWMGVLPTAGTAGEVTVTLTLISNNN